MKNSAVIIKTLFISLFVLISSKGWPQEEKAEVMIPDGHQAFLTTAAFSPDGKYVLTGAGDTKCILWDVASGKELRTFHGLPRIVDAVGFSPDGKLIFGAGKEPGDPDNVDILVWDVLSAKLVRSVVGRTLSSYPYFTGDSKHLVYKNWQNIYFSSIFTNEPAQFIQNPDKILKVSAYGGEMVTAGYQITDYSKKQYVNQYRIWKCDNFNALTGQPVKEKTVTEHKNVITACDLSADGKLLATGGADHQIIIRDIEKDTIESYSGHPGRLLDLKFATDNYHLLSWDDKGFYLIHNMNTRKTIQLKTGDGFKFNYATFSLDGKHIIAACSDGIARMYDVNGALIQTFKGHIESTTDAYFSMDEHYLVCRNGNKTHAWDMRTGEYLDTLNRFINGYAGSQTSDGRFEVKSSLKYSTSYPEPEAMVHSDFFVLQDKLKKRSLLLFSFDNKGWMILGDGNQIDASGDALKLLYTVRNLKLTNEAVNKYSKLTPGLFSLTFYGHVAAEKKKSPLPAGPAAGFGITSSKPCSDISCKPILSTDPSPLLQVSIQCHQANYGITRIFLNGVKIAERTSDREAAKEIRNIPRKITIPLISYFEEGSAKWEQDNTVEIIQYADIGGENVCNSLTYTFNIKEHALPKLIIPTGHTGAIVCLTATGDGKTIFSGGTDGFVKQWDTRSKKELNTFKASNGGIIENIEVSKDGAYLLTRADPEDVSDMIRAIEVNRQVTTLWDVAKGEKMAIFRGDEYKNLYHFSPDGKSLICLYLNKEIGIADHKRSDFIPDLPVKGTIADISEDGHIALIDNDKNFILWDVTQRKELNKYQGIGFGNLKLSPSGQYILTNGARRTSYVPAASPLNSWTATRSESKLIQPNVKGVIRQISFLPDGNTAIFVGEKGSATIYDLSHDKVLDNFQSVKDQIYATACLQGTNLLALGGQDGIVRLYDIQSKKEVFRFDIRVDLLKTIGMTLKGDQMFLGDIGKRDVYICSFKPGEKMDILHHQKPLEGIYITPDNKHLVTLEDKGKAYVWNMKDAALAHIYDGGDSTVEMVNVRKDGKIMLMPDKIVNGRYRTLLIDIENNSIDPNPRDEDFYDYYSNEENRVKGKIAAVQIKSQMNERTDGIIYVKDNHTDNVLFNNNTDNTIARFVPFESGDWILFTEDGYFMSSKDAAKNVFYTYHHKIYSFDQFDLQYNRPDIVLQRLGIAPQETIDFYKHLYEKRLQRMGYNPKNFQKEQLLNAPEIKILHGQEITETNQKKYTCELEISDEKFNIDRLEVNVNGVPVYGRKGLSLTEKASRKIHVPIEFDLSDGQNQIEFYAANTNGVLSIPQQITVNYTGPKTKPDLYIVAIGAGKYQDNDMNLNYAAKDATDITNLFRKNADKYGKIVPLLIKDDSVSVKRIGDIKNMLGHTRVDDQVILFYAGHGLFDKNKNYYLGTYATDVNKLAATGLPYTAMEDLLDNIAARMKTLWIDACFSGEFDKDEMIIKNISNTSQGNIRFRGVGNKKAARKNTAGLVTLDILKGSFIDLKTASGTTVISAASGFESAIEDSQWNNGVFTYCLINGLTTNSADSNHDNQITINELESYLEKNVAVLTNGLQKPTSRSENIKNNFVIWQR